MTVQSGDCLMVRYRECSTRNNDDCPDKNYSFQPCTKLTCPGKLSPKTYLVFCLYLWYEKGAFLLWFYQQSLSKTKIPVKL